MMFLLEKNGKRLNGKDKWSVRLNKNFDWEKCKYVFLHHKKTQNIISFQYRIVRRIIGTNECLLYQN